MAEQQQNRLLIVSVIGGLLIFVSLVSVTINAKKYKKNFRNEMAQRLDLEEKVSTMERGRQNLLSQLKGLGDQIDKSNKEIMKLRENLEQEKTQRSSLESALEKIKKDQETTRHAL